MPTRFTIAARLSLLAVGTVVATVGLTVFLLSLLPGQPLAAATLAVCVMAPFAIFLARTMLLEQRLDLVQRELLLDTMVQHTPVAMMLVDASGKIVFSNLAARQLLNEGRRLEGTGLDELLGRTSLSLRAAIERGGDGLFTTGSAGEEEETYHLARRDFSLNARRHELLLLRRL